MTIGKDAVKAMEIDHITKIRYVHTSRENHDKILRKKTLISGRRPMSLKIMFTQNNFEKRFKDCL